MRLKDHSLIAFLIIGIVGVLIIAGVGVVAHFLLPSIPTPSESEPTFCTQEAKQCPDGSYVGRTGPNCEFAACPAPTIDAHWKTMTDAKTGISFRYPETLTTTYIHTVDWPPSAQVVGQPYSCTEAGAQTQPAGRTSRRMVDDREYCVTMTSEGAAGSTYTQYAYALPYSKNTLIFTFTLRAPQCGNYDEPQKMACEQERASFDIDSVIDTIAQTVTVL